MSKNATVPVAMRCMVCTNPIPSTRRRDSVTCSKECSHQRYLWVRASRNAVLCDYCQRPATPEEKERYLAWRRFEAKGGDAAALLKENVRLKKQLATQKNLPTVQVEAL